MEIDKGLTLSKSTGNTSQPMKIIDEKPTSSATHANNTGLTFTVVIENVPTAVCNMRAGDVSSPSTSTAISKGPLDGWTKEEKFELYLGIKHKGSRKVEEIHESIHTKTLEEVKVTIAYYRDQANQSPECASRKLKMRKGRAKPLIPLASWAKLLTDYFSFKELQTETVSALRLIAGFEEIPPPIFTEQIDFRQIYHQIADAMEGKSLPDSVMFSEVLNSCVLNTALDGKSFIKLSTFKRITKSVNFREKTMPFFPRPTQDNELAIIRLFCSQRNYNPLCISEENLMPASSIPIVNPK